MKKIFLSLLFLIGFNCANAQTVSTYAGTGVQGSTDGSVATATLHSPKGLAVDAAGNIYFSDFLNQKIRKITPAGVVSTLAGNGTIGSDDGPGASATFRLPAGLAVDASGNVYVNHNGPFGSKIRKITPSGLVSSFAGTGEWDDYAVTGKDGPGNVATFASLKGMTIDAVGNLYVVDAGHRKIRKITPSGYVSTFAGSGALAVIDGAATAAAFYQPEGITIDAAGNLYVTETYHNLIRKITPAGVVSTYAGSGASGNANGPRLSASFKYPNDVVADASGNLYVADQGNNTIRKIASDGTVSTFAGTGTAGNADGNAAIATFKGLNNLAIDASGNLYVTDFSDYKIRKIAMTTNQTISGLSDMIKSTSDAPFNLNAVTSSGLPLTYSSSNPAVATISGNTVTIVGGGTAYITASQAGNSTYTPALNVSVKLTVNKLGQSISGITDIFKNSADVPFTLNGIASSGLGLSYSSSNPAVATITGNTVTIKGAGTTTITATQPGNGKYDAAIPVSVTLTVARTIATIPGFGDMHFTKSDPADFYLPEKATTGAYITYTSSDKSIVSPFLNIIRHLGIGTAIITATVSTGEVYTATVTVSKIPQTISGLYNVTKVANEANFYMKAVSSIDFSISYTSSNPAVATISSEGFVVIKGAGTTTITASNPGLTYYEAASQSVTLTVTKATQTILGFENINKLVTDGSFYLSAYTGNGLPVTYTSSNPAVATISGTKVTIVSAGETTITATQAGNEKYEAVSATATLTINKASQTITSGGTINKLLTDPKFSLPYNSSGFLPISYTSSNPEVATVSGSQVTIVGAGTTTFIGTQEGDAKYLPAIPVSTALIVSKASQTIMYLSDMTAVANDGYHYLNNARATSGLPLTYTSSNPAVATISGDKAIIVGAGTTTITATQAGNATYEAASPVSAILTVSKADQEIGGLTDMQSVATDGAFFINEAYCNSGLPITFTSSNPAVATVSGNMVTLVGAGTITITATQAGDNKYKAATPVSVKLIVTKANQSITNLYDMEDAMTNKSFTLGATASSGLTVTYTSSNPAVAKVSGNKVTFVSTGVTTITATQAGNGKYNAATPVSASLTVNAVIKTSQYITGLSDMAKLTTDQPFSISKTTTAGLPIIYTSSNTAVAKISGNVVTIAGPGSTTITASQPGNDQYLAAEPVSIILTVTGSSISKMAQIITGLANMSKLANVPDFNLTATASSELAVTFTSSDLSVATITGNKVTIIGAGTTTITATQAGNELYTAAVPVSAKLTVSKASQTITGLPTSSTINKYRMDAPFTLNGIASSGLAITYTSSNPDVATISGNTVTITGYGSTSITATQAGNVKYDAKSTTIFLIVSRLPQTITGFSDMTKLTSDAPFTLTATASSGSVINYTSSNPSVATVLFGKVTIVGPGTTTITATQYGDETYEWTTASVTLTVNSVTGLEENTAGIGMYKAYDNGNFTIVIEGDADLVNVSDLSGKIIYTGNSRQISVAQTGLYIVTMVNNNRQVVNKVLVK